MSAQESPTPPYAAVREALFGMLKFIEALPGVHMTPGLAAYDKVLTAVEDSVVRSESGLSVAPSAVERTFAPAELLDKCIMALSGEYVEKPDDSGEEWNAAVGYCIGKLRVMQEQLPVVAQSASVSISETAEPQHVCGLQGYNPMIDPPCPGCEAHRSPGRATK